MGSGGVAIAALSTMICLKVSFSDGLGGERKSQRKERKKQAFIYPIARHLPPHACAKRKSVFSENKCTASCSSAYGSLKKPGKYSGHFHKKFSGQDNILGVFRVFANSNNGKCAVRL